MGGQIIDARSCRCNSGDDKLGEPGGQAFLPRFRMLRTRVHYGFNVDRRHKLPLSGDGRGSAQPFDPDNTASERVSAKIEAKLEEKGLIHRKGYRLTTENEREKRNNRPVLKVRPVDPARVRGPERTTLVRSNGTEGRIGLSGLQHCC